MRGLIFLIFLIFFSVLVQAQTIDPLNQFEDHSSFTPNSVLIADAVRISGYSRPEKDPAFQPVSKEEMAKLVCKGNPRCGVFAAYLDSDVVYYRDDVVPNGHDHLVLHELIHWLQHHSGKYDIHNCMDTIVREREAYNGENQFIIEHNGFEFVHPPMMGCQ